MAAPVFLDTEPVFFDTDVCVYSRKMGAAEKHARPREWLQVLWDTQRGRISPRVQVNEVNVRASRPRQAAGEGRRPVRRRAGRLPGAIQTPCRRGEQAI